MSRPTNNYKTTNLDFIKTIAGIAEPFNSTLLDGYDEYEENISAYEISDTRECFLSVLNKIGEDGCKVLTDRVVNYIDDVSNIDTTIPSALLSQAESLHFPYKDKKIVEQLSRLTKCSPIIQSFVWALSTNASNCKTILRRLNIIDDAKLSEISAENNIDKVYEHVFDDISTIIRNDILEKHYLYIDEYNNVAHDGPPLLDFSWMINALFADEIIKTNISISNFDKNVIDFGKYNRTIFSIICFTYLMSKIYSESNINASKINLLLEDLNKLVKIYMPFLFNNNLFDPLQAAWSIIYEDATLDDYDECNHDDIKAFMKEFNEKLNDIAADAIMQFMQDSGLPESLRKINQNFILKLNANAFTYQQNAFNFINDIHSLFAIDFANYIGDGNYLKNLYSADSGYWEYIKDNYGFTYVGQPEFALTKQIRFDNYISDIMRNMFDLGKKIRTLREDLRLMTLRNSYKGTAALIQFAVFEYIHDNLIDLLNSAKEKYNIKYGSDNPIEISGVIKNIENNVINGPDPMTQEDFSVSEYWDYTEYFGRASLVDEKKFADWNDPEDLACKNQLNGWRAYGSMKEQEIFNFYTNVLKLSKDVYLNKTNDVFEKTDISSQYINLRTFIKTVLDSGIFSKKDGRTNSNYEAIYSGNIEETTNDSPWVAYKNTEYISKQIHPYMWNFTNSYVDKIYKSSSVTTAIQNAEYSLLINHIGEYGNIVNQHRLSENFVDTAGYVTRYEYREHGKLENTKSYDGIVYPHFAYDMYQMFPTDNSYRPRTIPSTEVSSKWMSSIKTDWYDNQEIPLTDYESMREVLNLTNLVNDSNFRKSITNISRSEQVTEEDKNTSLQNYSIDRYETAYGVMPKHNFETKILLSNSVSNLASSIMDMSSPDGIEIVALANHDEHKVVAKSLDGGKTWSYYPYSDNLNSIAITTADCKHIYMCGSNNISMLDISQNPPVLTKFVETDEFNCYNIDTKDGKTVLVFINGVGQNTNHETYEQNSVFKTVGLYISYDGCNTWEKIDLSDAAELCLPTSHDVDLRLFLMQDGDCIIENNNTFYFSLTFKYDETPQSGPSPLDYKGNIYKIYKNSNNVWKVKPFRDVSIESVKRIISPWIACPDGKTVYVLYNSDIQNSQTIFEYTNDEGQTWHNASDEQLSNYSYTSVIAPNKSNFYFTGYLKSQESSINKTWYLFRRSCFGHNIVYKENGYPFMRPLIQHIQNPNDNTQKINLGMLFINADDSIDTDIIDTGLCTEFDGFPRVVISEDGTHMLLRTSETEIRSYNITTHTNIYNEFEPALKLNAKIHCNGLLFQNKYLNDALIKTVDDAFYILIPRYDDTYYNYLFYIKNKQPEVLVLKQRIIGNVSDNDLFCSGMFLNSGERVGINTYYVNKHLPINPSEISGLTQNKTKYANSKDDKSSLDVLNEFVQMYSSKFYDNTQTTSFLSIPIKTSESGLLIPDPSVDLNIDYINNNYPEISNYTTEISVDSNGIIVSQMYNDVETSLQDNTRLPMARIFNINSDAGFNPVYIGDEGKFIINPYEKNEKKYTTQFKLAKSTGAAFELLGPEGSFNSEKTDDNSSTESGKNENIYDDLTDDDVCYQRIHEFYSYDNATEISADSFDKGVAYYKHGYTSVVENNGFKDDVYRIMDIKEITFTSMSEGNTIADSYVSAKISNNMPASNSPYMYGRIYMFLKSKNTLYSLIPRKKSTKLQKIDVETANNETCKLLKAINNNGNSYTITFENSYVIDHIEFNRINASNRNVFIYSKNPQELLNSSLVLVYVVGKNNANDSTPDYLPSPNFMLPDDELYKSLYESDISCNIIDNHMMIPYVDRTNAYNNVKSAESITDDNVNNIEIVKNGSLLFSLTDIDSEKMNQQLPDQKLKEYKIKSVTTEALNDFERFKEIKRNNRDFSTMNYTFKPWKINDLNLVRVQNSDNTDFGLGEVGSINKSGSENNKYIVQPYSGKVAISQNSSNKYTVSFWRVSESGNDTWDPGSTDIPQLDITLPKEVQNGSTISRIKTTEKITKNGTDYYNPIYGLTRESIGTLLKDEENHVTPQLVVKWEHENSTDPNSQIILKFSNSTDSDSSFINTESGLEYKSLSVFTNNLILNAKESGYFDMVIPQHIRVGNTMFYNIPIMRVLLTNVSDDKPKFLMTIINDYTDGQITLESNNYALVFISGSKPYESNSDIVYVTCYVAPMTSSNQTTPPSISNSLLLSELSFNFDVANILNKSDFEYSSDFEIQPKPLVDAEHVNIVYFDRISTTAKSYINYDKGIHQIRISEPYTDHQDGQTTYNGFTSVVLKINTEGMTKRTLKNTLLTAHGNVIAYDVDGNARPIMKIFGCSLDRIGAKQVLGAKDPTDSNKYKPLAIFQNSGRKTALIANPQSSKFGSIEDSEIVVPKDNTSQQSQDNIPVLTLREYAKTYDNNIHSDEINVNYSQAWDSRNTVSWITMTEQMNNKFGSIKYSIAPNYTDTRIGYINVCSISDSNGMENIDSETRFLPLSDTRKQVKITQNKYKKLYLDGSECTFDANAQSEKILKIFSSVDEGQTLPTWTASSDSIWIHITSATTGSGDAELNYNVDENTTGSKRVGQIKVSINVPYTAILTITQNKSEG